MASRAACGFLAIEGNERLGLGERGLGQLPRIPGAQQRPRLGPDRRGGVVIQPRDLEILTIQAGEERVAGIDLRFALERVERRAEHARHGFDIRQFVFTRAPFDGLERAGGNRSLARNLHLIKPLLNP